MQYFFKQIKFSSFIVVMFVLLISYCLVIVVWLFLTVPWFCLKFVIALFPDYTHLLFLLYLLGFVFSTSC